MRGGILLILSMMLVGAAGVALCHLANWNANLPLMTYAAAVTLVATLGALLPLALSHNGSQLSIAQSALVGTSLHLLICIAITAAIVFLRHPALAFVYWICAFYWATLATICVWYATALRRSPTARPDSGAMVAERVGVPVSLPGATFETVKT